jgi:hypothetical protein
VSYHCSERSCENKIDYVKGSLYEEIKHAHFIGTVRKKDIFTPIIGNESLHKINGNN